MSLFLPSRLRPARGACGDPVEPDTTHIWTATVQWSTAFNGLDPSCSCNDHQDQATIEVTWSGSAWNVVCTAGCGGANPIIAAYICDLESCTGGDGPHGASYRVLLDITQQIFPFSGPCGLVAANLNKVDFDSSRIDDGISYDNSTCQSGVGAQPTQVSYSATDNGTFECALSCSDLGASVTILYQ
jgi:hypothetical protein